MLGLKLQDEDCENSTSQLRTRQAFLLLFPLRSLLYKFTGARLVFNFIFHLRHGVQLGPEQARQQTTLSDSIPVCLPETHALDGQGAKRGNCKTQGVEPDAALFACR